VCQSVGVTWRKWALLGVTVFLVFVVIHAFLPWHWVGQLEVPAGHKGENVTFRCAGPWASAYAHGPAHIPFPFSGTPCSGRTGLAVMDVIDVGVGLLAFSFLFVVTRRRPAMQD
jgi:hypothetical protein